MQNEIETLKTQMADALRMIDRLTCIVETYAPEYAHGEPTQHVAKMARQLLVDMTPSQDRRFEFVAAAELVAQQTGKYD